MTNSKFVSHDGKQVELYVWDEVKNPKGVVKIAHGMAEHSARYDDFAKYLNSRGYIVVMNDHRGHGLSSTADSYGYEDGDMWDNNVKDQLAILEYCRQQYNLPLVMMGHSYGSFIVQAVVEQHPDVAGYVLCGSDYLKGASYTLCGIIAKSMCRNKGPRHPAQLLANLSFGMYEKKIPGKNNWLNRDESEVKKYNEDPMCGFVCSANFYRSFMNGAKQLYKADNVKCINTQQPILIISGANDPVGEYSKGVNKLIKFYNKAGVADVESHLYEDARHEILNEPLIKAQVYADVADFCDRVIG